MEDDFNVKLEVTANGDYELLSPPVINPFSVGGTTAWSVRNKITKEDNNNGQILLFKVDVVIDGTGEEEEELVGAFLEKPRLLQGQTVLSSSDCINSFKQVKIRCVPNNRPDFEKINIKHSYNIKSALYEKNSDGTYKVAKDNYKVNEINDKNFFLYGHNPSTTLRDREIVATHNFNDCADKAKYTVTHCMFTALARTPGNGEQYIILKDIFGKITGINAGHAFWKLSILPSAFSMDVEYNAYLINKLGTGYQDYLDVNMGFYPYPPLDPFNGQYEGPGKIDKPDPSSSKGSYTWTIKINDLAAGITYSHNRYTNPLFYNIKDYNCVHPVIEVGSEVNVIVPCELWKGPVPLPPKQAEKIIPLLTAENLFRALTKLTPEL